MGSNSPAHHLHLGISEPPWGWGGEPAEARELLCFQKQRTYYDFSSNAKISIKLSNEPNTIYRVTNKMVLALRISFEGTIITVF